MKVTVEISELIGKNIAVRNDVKLLFSVLLLHLDQIVDQSIFPRQLIRIGEMVDLLVLLKLFVNVRVDTP